MPIDVQNQVATLCSAMAHRWSQEMYSTNIDDIAEALGFSDTIVRAAEQIHTLCNPNEPRQRTIYNGYSPPWPEARDSWAKTEAMIRNVEVK